MEQTIFDVALNQWGAYEILEFILKYMIPVVGSLAIIVGGLWTVYKYFNEKNREFYSDILENVYSPLFNELVKNEFSRKLINDSNEEDDVKKAYSAKELPFIVWNGVRTNTKLTIGKTEITQEKYGIYDIDERLREICDDTEKLKYAPRDLVALIENYFFLKAVKGAPTYEKELVKIQIEIRRNIIIGYKKYRRKLGLKDVSLKKYCHSFMGWIWFK